MGLEQAMRASMAIAELARVVESRGSVLVMRIASSIGLMES
jgi:hypothetical protein